jgi:hypothetical protein
MHYPDILPPLRGLDENAGDVENGVIGAGHRKLRRAVYRFGLVLLVLAGLLLAYGAP